MSHIFFTAKTTTGRGTAFESPKIKPGHPFRNRMIFVTGTFTSASVKVEVSLDGSIWLDWGSAKTAAGAWEINSPFPFITVNITDATTASITATLV